MGEDPYPDGHFIKLYFARKGENRRATACPLPGAVRRLTGWVLGCVTLREDALWIGFVGSMKTKSG